MFKTKKKTLFKTKKNVNNSFLTAARKESVKTLSGNNALKFSSSGSDWVDQFSNLGEMRKPRKFETIAQDCETLWAQDENLFVRFTLYIRMISRVTDIATLDIKTTKAQSGAELRHEGIMRMLWLSQKSPEKFWDNIGLFVAAGSCKDLIVMMKSDLVYHGWEDRILDWNKMYALVGELLRNEQTTNLMRKYLPQIRANSACKTVEAQAGNMVAKFLCSQLFGSKNYAEYRRYKAQGTAHKWQQLISQGRFSEIDFKKIHGRALNLLVKSKFLRNQNLQDAYSGWVKKQDTVKYTGFVHELLCELDNNRDKLFSQTVDKQFAELVKKMAQVENRTNFIVVRDVSGSMGSNATGTNFTSFAVAKAMALYFSEFLTGPFANAYINFNSKAKLNFWKGSTPTAKWRSERYTPSANTNFQGVVDLFCKLKREGVDESDFPTGMLCISDGEFDRLKLHNQTNIEAAKNAFRYAGFSDEFVNNFTFVFWDIPNSFYSYYGMGREKGPKFETYGNVKNVFYMSGYSASNVKFLIENKVETAQDLFNAAMDQELLNLVK